MARQPTGKALLMREADRIARQQGVPPALFKALIQQESGWDPSAGSPAGARGLTQLMPGTARGLGVRDVLDPVQNMRGGARYLRLQLDRFHDPRLALSAYNSGPGGAEAQGRVENYAETQNYVRNVMAMEAQYAKMGAGSPVSTAPPLPSPSRVVAAQMSGADWRAPDPREVPTSPDLAQSLGPGVPSFGELISRVGPASARAVGMVEQQQAQQPEQAQQAAGTDTSQQGGGQPTMAPGDAGPPPQTDGGTPAVGGLNAEFARRFQLLQRAVKAAGGDLYIYSGGRDAQKQAGLYQAALRKYGSEAEARKWVAPPGKSNHDIHAGLKYGLGDGAVASDLRGDLAMAHQLAARFGLVFPLGNEAWHIELAGIRNMKR